MANKTTAAKPKIGGAVYVAPAGTTLPTDATTALDSAFKSLGYISDSGLVNSNTLSSNTVKAWGGDEVLDISEGRSDSFKYTLLDATSAEVLKEVFGDENVTVDEETGTITVKSKSSIEMPEKVYVIEMILKNNALKRITIPNGKVTAVGDVTYSDSAAVGYETTLKATADTDGNTHYEYIKTA